MADETKTPEAEAEKKRLLRVYVACGATVVLYYASFAPIDFGMLAWVCLVPWLFVALRGSRRLAVASSYGTGFLYHLLGLSWIALCTAPGWVATVFLEGFYSVGVVLAVRWMRAKTRLPVSVLLPPLWVMGEHHRGAHLLFIKFPWLLIGHAQHARTNLIQIADVTSIYGLSFLVVLVNAFIVDSLLLLAQRNEEKKELDDVDRRWLLKLGAYPLALLVLANVYGAIRSSQVAAATVEGPRILAVQCDLPQAIKENQTGEDPAITLADQNFSNTRIALVNREKELPDAILWSETVWLYPLNYEYPDQKLFSQLYVDPWNQRWPAKDGRRGLGDILLDRTEELMKLPGIYQSDLILGAYDFPPFESRLRREEPTWRNRVVQISPGGKILEHYDKINLVPASEGIPYKGTWFYDFVKRFVPPNFQTLDPGDAPHVMTLSKPPHWKLSCDICFEISFPELLRQGTAMGANVLFCPSNDGWFHTADDIASAEIELALAHARFRAIENRRGVVRIVNRGITCFIDPLGQVTKTVKKTVHPRNGDPYETELHVEGAILDTVPTTRLESFYVRFGDVFPWACWVASFGLIVFSRTREGTASPPSS